MVVKFKKNDLRTVYCEQEAKLTLPLKLEKDAKEDVSEKKGKYEGHPKTNANYALN